MKQSLIFITLLITIFSYQTQAGLLHSLQLHRYDDDEPKRLMTLWFTAAFEGNLEIIKKNIKQVDINAQDDFGNTALIYAASQGHEEIVKFFLQFPGININFKTDRTGFCTALTTAIFHGHENIVQLLLQESAINVNIQLDKYHGFNTPLIMACNNGNINIVKLLLQKPDINVNVQNRTGDSALIKATEQGHYDIVKLLLKSPNIDINIKNIYKDTALDVAVDKKRLKNFVELFLTIPGIYFSERVIHRAFNDDEEDHIGQLIKKKIDELIAHAFIAIEQQNIAQLKQIITQIDIETTLQYLGPKFLDMLLDKAFAANSTEIIIYLLQNAKDPISALSRFPFEFTRPSTELFQFFMNLAYDINPNTEILRTKHCQNCNSNATLFCSKCKTVYYCSPKCQKADWKSHKKICNKI